MYQITQQSVSSGQMAPFVLSTAPGHMAAVPQMSPVEMAQEAARKRELRLLKNSEAAKECRRRKKEYVRCLETRVAVLENQNKQLIEELQALKEMYVHKHVGSTGVVHAQDPTMVSLPKQVGGYSDQPPQHTLEHVLETAAAQASSSHAGGDAPQIHEQVHLTSLDGSSLQQQQPQTSHQQQQQQQEQQFQREQQQLQQQHNEQLQQQHDQLQQQQQQQQHDQQQQQSNQQQQLQQQQAASSQQQNLVQQQQQQASSHPSPL